MIQEIKIKNFLSYKEEVTLSFEATKDCFADEYQVVKMPNGTRLLRFIMVYGYNASGKSNLLKVFDTLSRFWNNVNRNNYGNDDIIPFLLDKQTPEEPSEFKIIFYVNGKKYLYLLSLDSKIVHYEKLDVYETVQPTNLFERKYENGKSIITFNSDKKVIDISKAAKEKIELECLPNISLFTARDNVNISLPNIDTAKTWLKSYCMRVIVPSSRMDSYAGAQIRKDGTITKSLLDFVNQADFNITNLIVKEKKTTIPKEYFKLSKDDSRNSQDGLKDFILEINNYKLQYEHTVTNSRGEEHYYLSHDDQSQGTKRIVGIETAIIDLCKQNRLLPIDEIESSLHPHLVEKMLYEYLRKPSNTQLIVTTHYDGLLDLTNDLLRRDSIWFTSKKEDGSTELYSLTDFKGINRLSSIRSAYRLGRFGATSIK